MRKLLILALAGLLAFLPLTATPATAAPYDLLTTAEAQYMANTLGCKAEVKVVEGDQLNGVFLVFRPFSGTGLAIYVVDGPGLNHESARGILLHEIGHCIDYQDGGIDNNYPWAEWFADEYAVEHSAQFGLKPDALYWDLYDWHATQGKPGSPKGSHGDAAGRLLHMQHQIDKRGGNFQGV